MKRSEQIKMATVNSNNRDSLAGIARRGKDPEDTRQPPLIRSHLDLIVLTTKEYSLHDFKEHFGNFKRDEEFHPEDRQPNYGSKWMMHFAHDIYMNIFTNPTHGYLPLCRIEIHTKKNSIMRRIKKFLSDIAAAFPSLKVSIVEYANDFYCINSDAVRDFFEIIRRFLYVPYQRNVIVDYGDQPVDRYGKLNRVCRLGDMVKAYERGKDRDKKGEGWPIEVLDRVRLEHAVKRQQLVKHGIDTICDLVRNPNFYEINKEVFRFANFTRSTYLPAIYDAYNSDPEKIDSFQAEYIFHRNAKTVKNIGQYVVDTPDFQEVLSTLHQSWLRFDKSWQSHIIS